MFILYSNCKIYAYMYAVFAVFISLHIIIFHTIYRCFCNFCSQWTRTWVSIYIHAFIYFVYMVNESAGAGGKSGRQADRRGVAREWASVRSRVAHLCAHPLSRVRVLVCCVCVCVLIHCWFVLRCQFSNRTSSPMPISQHIQYTEWKSAYVQVHDVLSYSKFKI